MPRVLSASEPEVPRMTTTLIASRFNVYLPFQRFATAVDPLEVAAILRRYGLVLTDLERGLDQLEFVVAMDLERDMAEAISRDLRQLGLHARVANDPSVKLSNRLTTAWALTFSALTAVATVGIGVFSTQIVILIAVAGPLLAALACATLVPVFAVFMVPHLVALLKLSGAAFTSLPVVAHVRPAQPTIWAKIVELEAALRDLKSTMPVSALAPISERLGTLQTKLADATEEDRAKAIVELDALLGALKAAQTGPTTAQSELTALAAEVHALAAAADELRQLAIRERASERSRGVRSHQT